MNLSSRRWYRKPKIKLVPVLHLLHSLVKRDDKSPKLQAFMDKKDELDSYLLRFERYAAMDIYTKMSETETSEYDNLKKALLTRYNYTEDGHRKRFREVKPETEETPDQFIIR